MQKYKKHNDIITQENQTSKKPEEDLIWLSSRQNKSTIKELKFYNKT